MASVFRPRRSQAADPFVDMLFNVLLVLSLLFALALVFINPPAKQGAVDLKAEFLITASWPDGDPADLDMWVQEPGGKTVWYKMRDEGLMHLDRDDRGNFNDMIIVNGKEVINPLNQEIVSLRGIIAGEYTVNLHYYRSEKKAPIQATVTLLRVNPRAEVVWHGSVTLDTPGVERTAIRFTLTRDGQVADLNTQQQAIVRR